MLNRRVHRRARVQRKVEIEPLETGRKWIFGPPKLSEFAEGRVLDIGCGGMSGTFPKTIEVGTACEVRIKGTEGKIQRTHGTVRNVRSADSDKILGIAFDEPILALGDPAREGPDAGPEGIHPFTLVVDDEPDVRRVLQRFLEGRGLHVESVPGATEALEVLRKWQPALMMIDLKMPGITGVQLLETMKAENLSVPNIWAMSGYVADEDALAALSLGAAEFLNKPFDLDHLDFSLQLLAPIL